MAKKSLEIIHEDDHLVVVNKAPDSLTIPDRFDPHKFNLMTELKKSFGEIYVVHRLDKETSGILVFAKTPEAHKSLNRQFQEREADKYYLALTKGMPYPSEDLIDKPIGPDPRGGGKMRIDFHGGKRSATAYEVVESYKNYSLVRLQLFTGRTHQVRVHMAGIGHPLAVDPLYGGDEAIFLSKIKLKGFNLKANEVERPLLNRVSLHAYQLSFDHPTSNERVMYMAPPPKDFRSTVRQLQKWSKTNNT